MGYTSMYLLLYLLCMISKKILLVSNVSWSAYFRRPLIEYLATEGYEVHVAAAPDHYTNKLKALPCTYHSLSLAPHGKNPLREIYTIWSLWRVLRRVQPAVFLGFSVKPVIYGSLLTRLLGIQTINNIPGLGAWFTGRGLLSCLIQIMYRISQKRVHTVFFQNQPSQDMFLDKGLIRPLQARRLPGSGVDLDAFPYTPPSNDNVKVKRFLLVGRIIPAKGVYEYIKAAERVRVLHPEIEFQMLGPAGNADLGEVSLEEVVTWQEAGIVNYLGETDNVLPFLQAADVIILPTSVSEGVPRVLLEAAAVGRPIIATDAVGCVDVVMDEKNGFLVPAKDAQALELAMRRMLTLTYTQRVEMAQAGRDHVEANFSHTLVIDAYQSAIQTCLTIK